MICFTTDHFRVGLTLLCLLMLSGFMFPPPSVLTPPPPVTQPVPCKFYPSCTKADCTFYHPQPKVYFMTLTWKFNLALWFQRNNFHCNKSIFVGCSLLESFPSQDPSGNSPYYLLHNSQDVSSEILVLDQPVIPELTFCFHSHHLSAWYCSDIIMRNSVLVTLGSQTVNS